MIGLFAAVECGDTKKAKQLLKQDVQQCSKLRDYRERTLLHLAAELGNEEMVDVLLDHGGTSLWAKDCADFTALHLACELGYDKIVARLLGKSPELADQKARKTELSCLHLAAIRGKVKVVKLLLELAPELVAKEDKLKRSPLHFAIEHGHEEIVEMLMESAKSNTNYGEATFHAAIRSGHDKIVSQLLDHRPQLIDVVDKCGESPLHLAAECGRHSIVELLFTRRQPRLAEVGGNYSMTLLHFAARYGFDAIVSELLVEQPHLIDVAGDSTTVLHLAAKHGHVTITEQLLAHRPLLIDAKDGAGRNALHSATVGGHLKVVERLLALKPDLLDVGDRRNRTALSLACSPPQPELVACLLAHGPTVFTQDMVWDVLEGGWRGPVFEVVKLMLSHKPELAASLNCGYSLLHRVFGYECHEDFYRNEDRYEDVTPDESLFDEELVLLVWQLSPPNLLHVTDLNNHTPFQVAIRSNNTFAIELVQWKFSLDEIVKACASCYRNCPASLLDQLCEALLLSLDRDVVGTVWEYLGFERPQRQANSKKRKMETEDTQ